MSLVDSYRLNSRLAKLEKLAYERTMGRGNSPSKAYTIWKYLVDNGSKTISDLNSELPKDVTSHISFFAKNDLLNINGNTVSANLDYKWDDVGVIPRTAEQELMNSVKDAPTVDDNEEAPVAPSKSRQSKAKPVKANIWSFKPEEVKAAIDAGVDVDSTDDKDRTPLVVAALSKREIAPEIIKILTRNGADPSAAIVQAVKYKRYDSAMLIANTPGYSPTKRVFYCLTHHYDSASAAKIIEVLVPKIDLDKFKVDRTMSSYYNLVTDLMNVALRSDNKRLFDIIYNKFKAIDDHPDVSYAIRGMAAREINTFGTCKLLIDLVHAGHWLENPIFDNSLANRMDKDDLRRLFNLVKSNFNNIHATNVDAFRREVAVIGMSLGENVDFTREEYSAERILKMGEFEVRKLFINSIATRDINALKAIDDSERKGFLDASYLSEICKLDNSAKRVINIAIKIISRSLKAANKSVDYLMSSFATLSVIKSKNTIVVEWLFDEDEDLLLQRMYRDSSVLSEATRSVFIAHGGQLNPHGGGMTRKPAPKRSDRRAAITDLEKILINDNSVRDIRDWEDNWEEAIPNLWEDEEVIDTVHDPKFDDSVLATQLRREVIKEPSKYNF